MNNQGGRTGQFNGNEDIHNEVNPHQSDRLYIPDLNIPYQETENSNIVPNNESNGALGLNISHSSSLTGSPQRFPDRLSGSNFLQYQGRNNNIVENGTTLSAEDVGNNHDQNLNLSLSLSSHPSGSRGEGMGGVFSANNRVLPFKRRYSDLASGESLTGESSTRGTQLGIAQELAASSQANSSNNVMNVSSFHNELANIHRSNGFQVAIGHSTMLVSNMQNQTQVATAPQGVIRANRLLNNYSRVQQVALPTQAPFFHQSGRYRFISFSRTDGATYSVQPLEYASNFSEPQQAYPQNINIMSSRNNAHLVVLPAHSEIRSEAITPLHNQRIIQGSLMHHPQYRRGNRANDPESLRFGSGTTCFLGNLLNHEEHGRANDPESLRFGSGTTHFLGNLLNHEQHGSSSRNVNSRTAYENSLVARYETQARDNLGPSMTSFLLDSNMLLDEVRATAVHIQEVAQRTIRAEQDIQNLLHNLPPHEQVVAVEQNEDAEDVNIGLAEEEILKHIKRENFELIGERTPENNELCSICQEDYVNGEEVGRLDCVHRFHINCIQQWLVIKNLCPICKQTALATDHGDDDE